MASASLLVSENSLTCWQKNGRQTETKVNNGKKQETKEKSKENLQFNRKKCPSTLTKKKRTIRRASTITAAILSRSGKAASRGLGIVAQTIADLKSKRSGDLACSVCGSFVCNCGC